MVGCFGLESVGKKIWGNCNIESGECGLCPKKRELLGEGGAAVAGSREFCKSKYGSGETRCRKAAAEAAGSPGTGEANTDL